MSGKPCTSRLAAHYTTGVAQKNLISTFSRDERLTMINHTNPEMSLTTQTTLLGLNWTSLYYQALPPAPDELHIKCGIDEIYTDHRLAARARHQPQGGVAAYEMGLATICPGPNLSPRATEHRVSCICA